MTTTQTITTNQLAALRDEAATAGDLEQVAICNQAINGHQESIAICVEVISNREAMED